jgi:hypothetical protein
MGKDGSRPTCVKLSASSTAVSVCFVGSSFSLGGAMAVGVCDYTATAPAVQGLRPIAPWPGNPDHLSLLREEGGFLSERGRNE